LGNPPRMPLRTKQTSKRRQSKKFPSAVVTHIDLWQAKFWSSVRHKVRRSARKNTVCSTFSNGWEGSTKENGKITFSVSYVLLVNTSFGSSAEQPNYLLSVCRKWCRLSSLRYYLVCVQLHYRFLTGMELIISCLTQPTLSQAFQTHPLVSAAMLVIAMPFGVCHPRVSPA